MATKVVMEALSPTMEEGRVVKWTRAEGDAVKAGDVLAEVETDKAVMELVARADGVLRRILAPVDTSAPVGTLLAVIAAAGEDIGALVAGAPAAPPAPSAPSPRPGGAAAGGGTSGTPAPPPSASPAATPPASGGTGRSSPLARRLAADAGVSLGAVSGSGPGGRIVKRDVEAALAGGGARPAVPGAAGDMPAPAPAAAGPGFRDIPLTQIRKTIARRLVESIGPIPTFYLTAEYDLGRVSEMRAAMAAMGDDYKVSVNDVILKAVATALAQHPEVNAHWLGDRIRQHDRVHLGMAVATDDGLIVPVIFDAHAKRMREISREARELAKKARERKLKPEEYTGSTFSVSNLGMFGIDQFTAIINPPECGILAIGTASDQVVLDAGTARTRKVLRVTMSCDHRAVDGAVGATFLQALRRMIENPLMLVY
ncbi:MAG: 2-oxo acid dehydrogenase subunit E2 [Gemmatimonadetes bacterium]|nr:2-oxo acid dehydrogenase subunit E2 [Gemmatimonadota bacterium]